MLACQGLQPDDHPNINLILVYCGYLIPPPASVPDANNRLHQPVYVCSSTVRATIKEVSFHYRHTAEGQFLSDLSVTRVAPKVYLNAEKPMWAVEKLSPEWNLSDVRPLWGIINSDRLNNSEGLWKVSSEHLYLPAFSSAQGEPLNSDSLVRASPIRTHLMNTILHMAGRHHCTRLPVMVRIMTGASAGLTLR